MVQIYPLGRREQHQPDDEQQATTTTNESEDATVGEQVLFEGVGVIDSLSTTGLGTIEIYDGVVSGEPLSTVTLASPLSGPLLISVRAIIVTTAPLIGILTGLVIRSFRRNI